MKILEPNDITQFVWGVEPNYKEKFKIVDPSITKNIELNFRGDQLDNEKRTLVEAKFRDKKSKQVIDINIKNRNRNFGHKAGLKRWKILPT